MGCPGSGPCLPYVVNLDCCLSPSGILPSDPCLLDGVPVDQAIIDSTTLAASQILWALTGRQFSVCSAKIRPCRKACDDVCCSLDYGFPWSPVKLPTGDWTNVSCDCQGGCSCTNLAEVNLPNPVCSVSEVLIDGVAVDPATYRIDGFQKLVRLGSDVWPTCQDLTKPDSEVGTWSVTLSYGRPPPQLVLLATAELACELLKSCLGKQCRLPQRISSVTRQGISVSFLDDMQFLDKGLTGIYLVDLAAATFNPKRLARKSNVSSPDSLNQWRVTTWENSDPASGWNE